MATTSATEWDNEYARLARVASQLRTTGILTSADTVRSLQLGLARLDASLDSMAQVLPPPEVTRRRRLVQHLQSSSANVANSENVHGSTTTNIETSGILQSKLSTAMQQQDDMIDQLAVGVGRLKTQSTLIGEEAALHVNLMTDMEGNLDLAAASLTDQTRRAATLREEQSLWRLQLIVAGLSVLLVLEIFLGLTP